MRAAARRDRPPVSRVWEVPARTGSISELAEQLVESGIEKVTVEATYGWVRREGA